MRDKHSLPAENKTRSVTVYPGITRKTPVFFVWAINTTLLQMNSYAKTAPEYFLRWECFLHDDRSHSVLVHDTVVSHSTIIQKKDWSLLRMNAKNTHEHFCLFVGSECFWLIKFKFKFKFK